jgi:gluconolactonase
VIYICNNGGFEWSEMPLPNGQVISVGEYQSARNEGGSVQVLDLHSGKLETIYTECMISTDMSDLGTRTPTEFPSRSVLRGPDDLVFDAAGGFWIADFGKSRPRSRDVTGVYYGAPASVVSKFPTADPTNLGVARSLYFYPREGAVLADPDAPSLSCRAGSP